MRDLERAETISGDFLLVFGDVISNIALEPALAKHRARREKDKNAIMTMILREAGIRHRSKSRSLRPVFVIDPATERCLHYEEISRGRRSTNYVTLDPDILTTGSEIEIREDLIDCRIDICTQDVLLAWSDNFDYTTVRRSFLRGVLKDYETYGKTVHTYVVTDNYAARLKSLRAYDAINKDIMGRWTYPFCPDSNLIADQNYHVRKGKNYQETDVRITGTANVKKSIIGRDTSIGDGSTINGASLGRRCNIGKDVFIDGAYIWDDVTVKNSTTILQAVVGDRSIIGENCTVERAALLSFQSQIPDNLTISEGRMITRHHTSLEAMTDEADASDASSVVSSQLFFRSTSASNSTSSISTLTSSDSDLELRDTSRRGSFRSDASDEQGENRDFHLEATASILDGLQKEDSPETIMLELNGYRMSTNASQHEVRKALVAALMRRVSNLTNGDSTPGTSIIGVGDATKHLFTKYKTLIERTLFDRDANLKVDQVDFLILFQKEASIRPAGDQLMLFVAKEAYDQEIVEEDGILQWWEDERSKAGETLKVRSLTEKFITYLQEAEEEDDSDEEDEDEEDED